MDVQLIFSSYIAIVVLLTGSGCEPKPAPTPTANVVIISIDALRADHLSCYGYSRKTSPFIDAFAEDSIVFENAVTPRPKTTPSLVSMITGQYPHRHGIRNLEVPLNEPVGMPVALKRNGLATAAFVSNWILRPADSGLDKSFDVFNAKFTAPEMNRKNIFQRTASETNDDVFSWLLERHKQPFFLWVHYIDPHGPYSAPAPYDDVFHHQTTDMHAAGLVPLYQRLPNIAVIDGKTDFSSYVDQYDNEIKYTDHHVGQLLNRLRSLDVMDNSLVIVTADHGESLRQHNYYFEHGREVYEDCSNIPLIIRFPVRSEISGGKRVAALTSLMDIYPTVLETLGIKNASVKPMDGKSLLPLIYGKPSIHDEIFIENFEHGVFNRLAIRTEKHKLIRFNQKQHQCFDLSLDPGENSPRGCTTEVVNRLKVRLEQMRKDALKNGKELPKRKASPVADDIEALRNLGYIK